MCEDIVRHLQDETLRRPLLRTTELDDERLSTHVVGTAREDERSRDSS